MKTALVRARCAVPGLRCWIHFYSTDFDIVCAVKTQVVINISAVMNECAIMIQIA